MSYRTYQPRPDSSGGARLYARQCTLGFAAAGTPISTVTGVTFEVRTPSSRLRLGCSIAFEPRSPGVAFTDTSILTELRALRRNPVTGIWQPLDAGVAGIADRTLPVSWELESAARALRGTVTLTSATGVTGRWVVAAEWEPPPDMCDEEWLRLLAGCECAQTYGSEPNVGAGD